MKTELPKIKDFLKGLQKSWKGAKKSTEVAKEAIKKQFDRKKCNLQGLKVKNNMWLKAKNIQSNQPSKKLDQKKCRLFKISKNIGQEVFQLELPEEQTIYNMFNEDLLTQCREPHFKEQHIDLVLPPKIINKEEEYKVEEVRNHRK